jgi:hypothetical protein
MTEQAAADGLGLASLFRGIFGDVRGLVRQEIQLAKAELLKEWGKAKTAAAALAGGAAVLGVGALLLCLAGVSAIHEVAALPWWASFLIVGGAFTLLGAGLLYGGRRKAGQVNVIPSQAVRAASKIAEPTSPPAPEEPPPPPAAKGEESSGATWGLIGVALLAGVALEGFLGRRSSRKGAEAPAAAVAATESPEAEGAAEPGFLEKLAGQLGGEVEKIQDEVIVALVALVREMGQKSITALAALVEAKVSEVVARVAAAVPPQAESGQADAAGSPTPPEPPAV